MKLKRIYILFTMIVIFIANLTVYAETGGFGENQNSQEKLQLANGRILYNNYTAIDPEDGIEKTWYRFFIYDKESVEEVTLGDEKYYVIIGQNIYMTTNNNGNPYDLTPLKDKNNFDDVFDVVKNTKNLEGTSYISKAGKQYPTLYPSYLYKNLKNYNFKTETKNPLTKVKDSPCKESRRFWTHTNGLTGNIRWVQGPDNKAVPDIFYMYDYRTNDYVPYKRSLSIIKEPWKTYPSRIFKEFWNKRYENEGLNDSMLLNYQFNEIYTLGLKDAMNTLLAKYGIPQTEQNRAEMFYQSCSVPTMVDFYQGGLFYEIHGGGWKADGVGPAIVPARNLILFNLKIMDQDGKIVNPEADALKADGETEYVATWDVILEGLTDEEMTYNTNILTNFFGLYNENEDLSRADMYFSDIESKNKSRIRLKSATMTYIDKDTTQITTNDVDFPDRVATYQKKFTIPQISKDGKFVESVTFWAYTPWQLDHYKNTEDFVKNDNINPKDDFRKITFSVEQKYQNDLELIDLKLTDIEGNTVDDVIKNQEYILFWKIRNIGENDTKQIIDKSIFTNELQGQYFSELRDGSIGNTVNSNNSMILEKGEEVEFKTQIHIPLNTNLNNTTFTAFIPKSYDEMDNKYVRLDDVKTLKVPVLNPSLRKENLAIVDLKLLDSQTQLSYEQLNLDDVTYDFDLNESYDIAILVKKTDGTAIINNPKLNLYIRDSEGDIQDFQLTSQDILANTGDTATFKLRGYRTNGNLVDVMAQIPEFYNEQGLDDLKIDNSINKIWKKEINLTASNFQVNPSRIKLKQDDPIPVENIGFSVDLGLEMTSEQIVDNILFVILDKDNNIIYKDDNIAFNRNNLIKYQGTIENYSRLKVGNNPMLAVINFNKDIYEYNGETDPYEDNTSNSNILVQRDKEDEEKEILDCDDYNLDNSWSQTFQMFRKTGTMKSRKVTSCGKNGCKTRTIYYCVNVSYKSWTETRSYYEKFSIEKVMFRSPSTIDKYGGWVDILGNNKGIVRAGNWYEISVMTHYVTNRPDMPDRWRKNKCNYQNRSPGLSSLPKSPQFIQLKISGYGDTEYYFPLYHYKSSGSWYNHKRYYRPPLRNSTDIMGETSTRRYIPKTGKDGTITFDVKTEPFRGYEYDENHPREKLQDCRIFKVYVNNGLNIRTQILGGN